MTFDFSVLAGATRRLGMVQLAVVDQTAGARKFAAQEIRDGGGSLGFVVPDSAITPAAVHPAGTDACGICNWMVLNLPGVAFHGRISEPESRLSRD